MKFLHAADLHLDSPLRGLERYAGAPVDEVRGATRRALENLVELAVGEAVDFVLLAGDLYDGDWQDYNTGLYFNAQMARLREAGIRVFLVAGNHDAASRITRSLRPPDNVHAFATGAPESVVVDDLGAAVHGQGFAARAVTEDLSAGFPAPDPHLFNIGLLHTSLDGRPGHAPYAPCTVAGLRARGYQYWALGHVHTREVVSEEPWIVFPGNTQGRHARETGPKGCTLVRVADGRVAGVEHRDLDVVRWLECPVDAGGADSVDEVLDRTARAVDGLAGAAGGRLLAVRLRLAGVCAAHGALQARHDQVLNECRAHASAAGGVWVEKVVLGTARERDLDAALARDDAFGDLLRSVRDLEPDAGARERLGAELADLRAALPASLRDPDGEPGPLDGDALQGLLEEVRELLLERLLGGHERA